MTVQSSARVYDWTIGGLRGRCDAPPVLGQYVLITTSNTARPGLGRLPWHTGGGEHECDSEYDHGGRGGRLGADRRHGHSRVYSLDPRPEGENERMLRSGGLSSPSPSLVRWASSHRCSTSKSGVGRRRQGCGSFSPSSSVISS